MQIIDGEGRMFLKDNFEGGATWAFEVGSRSGVYPIIVEDLNPPRELLIEVKYACEYTSHLARCILPSVPNMLNLLADAV